MSEPKMLTKEERAERRTSPLNLECHIHKEPPVLIWRCEVPSNMNGAPRTVCPECMEEEIERLNKRVRSWEQTSEAQDMIIEQRDAEIARLKEALTKIAHSDEHAALVYHGDDRAIHHALSALEWVRDIAKAALREPDDA